MPGPWRWFKAPKKNPKNALKPLNLLDFCLAAVGETPTFAAQIRLK
jgi:hypothetical protein